ncbi:hypothetical protein [Burkholderia cepacia]|uniref:hypothetical protein n=1 Tax=Burkholderia cepacia TaxID=292 RepID=UPI001907222D|nr:hypothetical protein [Burkholderia cepacia]MBJ9756639.1 hypothetical protein [Burkholderia cepacia]
MLKWTKWVLAMLLSIGATSAFAEGGCQSGFAPRMYPHYKNDQYIGMFPGCAPIPCTPGYQDSTCAVPLRNAAIPQPQCQTGAGWTTVSASVWQGSRWSVPQCSYQASPNCPPGQTQQQAPSWNGSSWVGLVCAPQASTSTPPSDRDWAKICTDAVRSYSNGQYRMTFNNNDFIRFQWGDGVVTMNGGGWGKGPLYYDGDYRGNDWQFVCAVRIDNGAVHHLYVTPHSGYQGG